MTRILSLVTTAVLLLAAAAVAAQQHFERVADSFRPILGVVSGHPAHGNEITATAKGFGC